LLDKSVSQSNQKRGVKVFKQLFSKLSSDWINNLAFNFR